MLRDRVRESVMVPVATLREVSSRRHPGFEELHAHAREALLDLQVAHRGCRQ